MKKSKWDIIGKDIDRESVQDYDRWFLWWYDGEDYFDYDYDDLYNYEYTDTIYQDYVSKRGIRVTMDRMMVGSYIDMISIYPPQTLRQIKIDYLLGIDKWRIYEKPTIGDLLKNNKKDEN